MLMGRLFQIRILNMKKIIFATLVLLCFAFPSFAQSPQQMEQDLVKSLEEVSKNGTYAGNYDEEKLGTAQENFKNKLLKYTKTPSTLKYPFNKLQKQMKIATSPDGKFRVYSWDLEDGGTMHDFDSIYQYQSGDGKVYARSASQGAEEGDYGSFAPKIYEVQTKKGKVYLVLTTAIGSSQDYAQSINAMKIVGNKLDDKFKIFKTNSGLTDSIGFGFNAFSVDDRKGGFILILFDGKTNILKIPVVVENEKYPNGEVTNRFINYKFNGEYFVKSN